MPLLKISPRKLMAVHNEYRLTGGGSSGAALTGKVSPITGKPFFQGAIGHRSESAFTKTEVSVPAGAGKVGLKVLALDTRPAFKNLGELEAAIGRPLADGEWVKTYWTTMTHEDGQANWQFDGTWEEYSAKHQITAADRLADAATDGTHTSAPAISFINDLGSAPPENPKLDYDGVKRTYFLRRIEVAASEVQGSYLEFANLRSVAELEALQTRTVTLNEARFAHPNMPVKVRKNAEVTLDMTNTRLALAPFGAPMGRAGYAMGAIFNATLEWMADGVAQKPISVATTTGSNMNFISRVQLPVPRDTAKVEFWFVSEIAGQPSSRKVTPGNFVNRIIEFVG